MFVVIASVVDYMNIDECVEVVVVDDDIDDMVVVLDYSNKC
jgi:hypothetical protein